MGLGVVVIFSLAKLESSLKALVQENFAVQSEGHFKPDQIILPFAKFKIKASISLSSTRLTAFLTHVFV